MSHIKQDGYNAGAMLLLPHIRKLRNIVEFQKFQCRVLVDDERTRQFKVNTEDHPDSIHAMRYNSEQANKITVEGKKNGNKSGT